MKTITLKIAAMICTLALVLTSCDKEVESSALTMDSFNSGTLTLYMYANLDLTNVETEMAPEGTKVIISTNYYYFNSGASGTWTDTAFTDADGVINIELPVPSGGIEYTITPVDFEANQTQFSTSAESTVKKIWKASSTSIDLYPNQSVISQIEYNANNYNNYKEMVNIKLYIQGEFNENNSTYETLPVNELTLASSNGDWSFTASISGTTTLSSGESYSVLQTSVPKGVYFNIEPFTASKIVLISGTTETTTKTYSYYIENLVYYSNEATEDILLEDDEVVFEY